MRDPLLTFDETQIAAVPAIERFRAGTLGMMLGFRDLTPRLRAEGGPDHGGGGEHRPEAAGRVGGGL